MRVKRLRRLSAIFAHHIDFSRVPGLIDLATDWNVEIDASLFLAKQLKRLWLRGYRPKGYRDLRKFTAFDKLEYLHVALSNIISLKGVGAIKTLRELALSYCARLEDASALIGRIEPLEELELNHCGRIQDLEMTLEKLTRLRKLILSHCGSLPSLKFVRRLSRLEFLSFVHTDILDGDIKPTFHLKFVGFNNKRHYSHTFQQVRAITEERTSGPNLYGK